MPKKPKPKDLKFRERLISLRHGLDAPIGKHVSQEQVAKDAGMSTAAYQFAESGVIPGYAILMKLAQYFGVTDDYLLGREKPIREVPIYKEGPTHQPEFKDRDGLFGRTKQMDVGGQKFAVTTHDPDHPSAEAVAISALMEILGSGDPVLVPAIQANLRAFQAAARKEAQLSEQKEQIQLLKSECDEFRKKNSALESRIEALERRMGDHHLVNEISRDLDAPGKRAAV